MHRSRFYFAKCFAATVWVITHNWEKLISCSLTFPKYKSQEILSCITSYPHPWGQSPWVQRTAAAPATSVSVRSKTAPLFLNLKNTTNMLKTCHHYDQHSMFPFFVKHRLVARAPWKQTTICVISEPRCHMFCSVGVGRQVVTVMRQSWAAHRTLVLRIVLVPVCS